MDARQNGKRGEKMMFLSLFTDILSAIGVVLLIGALIIAVIATIGIVSLWIGFVVAGIKVLLGKDK